MVLILEHSKPLSSPAAPGLIIRFKQVRTACCVIPYVLYSGLYCLRL